MIQGLPERLAERREQYGLSQRAVAERLKISFSVVSGYERGERTPSVDMLLKLSALYHCSIDYLLGRDQNVPATAIDVSGLNEAQIKALQELVDTMRQS